MRALGCVISFFYIKPQHRDKNDKNKMSCVISFFYIKPQLGASRENQLTVVLYLSSTSNHNPIKLYNIVAKVVLYLSSTSNHNR